MPSEQAQLTTLLADLPGLHPVPDIDPGDSAAYAERVASLALDSRFALHFARDQLSLCRVDRHGRYDSDQVRLLSTDLLRRSGKPTELQRACFGTSNARQVRVLDAFAGWGMDGLSLAQAGAQVTCIELQPALVALLRDACRRVAITDGSISIICGSALDVLATTPPNTFDVIYLDPMFPARKKGALPNKRLQWLAELCVDHELNETELVRLAQQRARSTVVLKRRRKDPVLEQPQRQVLGSAVRYDLYPSLASRFQ